MTTIKMNKLNYYSLAFLNKMEGSISKDVIIFVKLTNLFLCNVEVKKLWSYMIRSALCQIMLWKQWGLTLSALLWFIKLRLKGESTASWWSKYVVSLIILLVIHKIYFYFYCSHFANHLPLLRSYSLFH
jgi:hypothetical protein